MHLKDAMQDKEDYRNKIVLCVNEQLEMYEQSDAAREYLESILEKARVELLDLAESSRDIEWQVNHSFPQIPGWETLDPNDAELYLPVTLHDLDDPEDFDAFETSLRRRLESGDFPRQEQAPLPEGFYSAMLQRSMSEWVGANVRPEEQPLRRHEIREIIMEVNEGQPEAWQSDPEDPELEEDMDEPSTWIPNSWDHKNSGRTLC